MRFAGVKELKQKTMDILDAAKKEDVIITAYGKPAAVLHHISEDDLADYIFENDPAFKMRIEEAFNEYRVHGGMKADQLVKKLGKRCGAQKV
jgi:prevent-host-death family protein